MKNATAIMFAVILMITAFCGCNNEENDGLIKEKDMGTFDGVSPVISYIEEDINESGSIGEAKLDSTDISRRCCYSCLNDNQKHIYLIMLNIVKNMKQGFYEIGNTYSEISADISVAYHALTRDFPEIYYIPASYYISSKNGKTSISLSKSYGENAYLINEAYREKADSDFSLAISEILSNIKNSDSDYEKELKIHDLLAADTSYAEKPNDLDYTAYGPLVNGTAVCEGYAKAFSLLLNMAGVRAKTVSGVSKGVGHMWNIVEIDGGWYHTDITLDDLREKTLHTYFNLTDRQISADHTMDVDFKDADKSGILAGNGYNYGIDTAVLSSYNYFVYNGMTARGYSVEKVTGKIIEAYEKNQKTVEIYIEDADSISEFSENLKDNILKINAEIKKSGYRRKIKLKKVAYTATTLVFLLK